MKIVLAAVNAKYIHSNLAVYSLKAYAKEYEEHIEIREYTINHYREDILAGLYGACPDVLAFSCYIWNMDLIRDLMTDVKQIMPEVPVWLLSLIHISWCRSRLPEAESAPPAGLQYRIPAF